MSKTKRKWGDRKDGIWLKDIPALNRMMPILMPNRADNEAYINVDIDVRPLNAYLEKVNAGRTEDKYTFFHIISAALGKAFVLRPKMNRFIVGSKLYQRRNITVAFTVKKRFDDHAEEALVDVSLNQIGRGNLTAGADGLGMSVQFDAVGIGGFELFFEVHSFHNITASFTIVWYIIAEKSERVNSEKSCHPGWMAALISD